MASSRRAAYADSPHCEMASSRGVPCWRAGSLGCWVRRLGQRCRYERYRGAGAHDERSLRRDRGRQRSDHRLRSGFALTREARRAARCGPDRLRSPRSRRVLSQNPPGGSAAAARRGMRPRARSCGADAHERPDEQAKRHREGSQARFPGNLDTKAHAERPTCRTHHAKIIHSRCWVAAKLSTPATLTERRITRAPSG